MPTFFFFFFFLHKIPAAANFAMVFICPICPICPSCRVWMHNKILPVCPLCFGILNFDLYSFNFSSIWCSATRWRSLQTPNWWLPARRIRQWHCGNYTLRKAQVEIGHKSVIWEWTLIYIPACHILCNTTFCFKHGVWHVTCKLVRYLFIRQGNFSFYWHSLGSVWISNKKKKEEKKHS